MYAVEQDYDELAMAVRMFQNTMMRIRYSAIPVAVAPHGLTLGGSCEMNLHADKICAAAETYTGLVEWPALRVTKAQRHSSAAIHIFLLHHYHHSIKQLIMSDTRVRTDKIRSIAVLTMTQGTAPAANKLAMSKALGAAFLNHQVEQLEKSVNGSRTDGNWRDRRYRPGQERVGNNPRRPQNNNGPRAPRAKGGVADRVEIGSGDDRARGRKDEVVEKDADVVIVDASVLVHALPQVKKWCRDGRKEIVIVPLEGTLYIQSISTLSNPSLSVEHS